MTHPIAILTVDVMAWIDYYIAQVHIDVNTYPGPNLNVGHIIWWVSLGDDCVTSDMIQGRCQHQYIRNPSSF